MSDPLISVIVCSKQPPSWDIHRRNAAKTAGCAHEYVRVDNSSGTRGICAAYNEGVGRAGGDILVFMHEDVFFMEPGWGGVLRAKFEADTAVGMVGVAGTQYLMKDNFMWIAAGRPFLRGRVVHELDGGRRTVLTVFSADKSDAEVVAVDGLFFAVRKELFGAIRFDDATFPGFHFYDLDICMQVRTTHTIMVTWDILLKHLSAGTMDRGWREAGLAFLKKHGASLPASCADTAPSTGERPGPMNYRLEGKVPKGIIM
jgi:hypothetical protein